MLTHPVTLYWHWADQLCFVVPTSSWVPCNLQAGTNHIFNVFGMIGPSTNRESNPWNHLVSAGSPLSSPFTICRGHWGPIRHQGAPSGAPTPDPNGVIKLRNTCFGSHSALLGRGEYIFLLSPLQLFFIVMCPNMLKCVAVLSISYIPPIVTQ